MNINTPLHILVIDTGRDKATTLLSLLYEGNRRHNIKVVHTVHEAELWSHKEPADLILLLLAGSLKKPYEHVQRCLAAFPQMPIVLLDESDNEIIGTQAIRAGVQDYLSMHLVSSKILSRTVRYALERNQHLQLLNQKKQDLITNLHRMQIHQDLGDMGTWEYHPLRQVLTGDARFFQHVGLDVHTDSIHKEDYLAKVHAEDLAVVRAFFTRISRKPEPQVCDHRLQGSGEDARLISLSASFRLLPDREQGAILGTSQLPDRSQAFQRTRKESQFQKRMLAIRDQLLNQTAFNIRTPLLSITHFLFLLKDHPLQRKQKESFNGIQASLDELQHHLNRLLNVTLATNHPQALHVCSFELRRELELNQQLTEGAGDEDAAAIHLRLAANIPYYAQGDPVHLFQVSMIMKEMLRNLCNSSSRINLYIHAEKRKDGWFNLCLRYKSASPFAITPKWKIWGAANDATTDTPYPSEKEEHARTSLFVIQDLLKVAHGSFNTRQSETGGWEILISIPMQVATEEIPTATTQHWVESLHILLVEDHLLNQIAIRNVIQSWSDNITVDVADNGEIGVQMFQESHYDLILMDIQMPVMNGIEAAKLIRAQSNIPIIALSAKASEQEAKRCLDAGINSYLSKPFQLEALKNLIFREVSILR
jgi:CheY-like chemotaxis protein